MKFINGLWELCGGGILRSDSVELRLAERQILVKDEKSKSWFVYKAVWASKHGESTWCLVYQGTVEGQVFVGC